MLELSEGTTGSSVGEPRSSSMRLYFCLYHEATLVNLLECILYHDYAAEALHEAAIDLVDYVAVRVGDLAGGAYSRPPTGTTEGGPRQQVVQWLYDIGFSTSIACVSLLRYICEHLPKLQLSVMARVIDRHDALLLQVPLIENPPWVRRAPQPPSEGSSGAESYPAAAWQKWVGNAWVDVEARDLLKLSPCEGQPWLALLALTMEPEVRKRYALHSHRKSTLLRVRKYLNTVLLDQCAWSSDAPLPFMATSSTKPCTRPPQCLHSRTCSAFSMSWHSWPFPSQPRRARRACCLRLHLLCMTQSRERQSTMRVPLLWHKALRVHQTRPPLYLRNALRSLNCLTHRARARSCPFSASLPPHRPVRGSRRPCRWMHRAAMEVTPRGSGGLSPSSCCAQTSHLKAPALNPLAHLLDSLNCIILMRLKA